MEIEISRLKKNYERLKNKKKVNKVNKDFIKEELENEEKKRECLYK